MASYPNIDVFSQVEAVLDNAWLKNHSKDVTTVLEDIEMLGVDAIRFQRGNHVVCGSLDQIIKIREHLLGSTKSPKSNNFSLNKIRAKDISNEKEFIAKEEVVKKHEETRNSLHGDDGGQRQSLFRELMADGDIWEYIENKKREDLQNLEEMFYADITKEEDDSGVLKVLAKPKLCDTSADELDLMFESLVGLYQDTLNKCVVETCEQRISERKAKLTLDYISDRFPEVLAKKCIYNDNFLFIGPRHLAHEAKNQFRLLSSRISKGDLKEPEERYHYGRHAFQDDPQFEDYDTREYRYGGFMNINPFNRPIHSEAIDLISDSDVPDNADVSGMAEGGILTDEEKNQMRVEDVKEDNVQQGGFLLEEKGKVAEEDNLERSDTPSMDYKRREIKNEDVTITKGNLVGKSKAESENVKEADENEADVNMLKSNEPLSSLCQEGIPEPLEANTAVSDCKHDRSEMDATEAVTTGGDPLLEKTQEVFKIDEKQADFEACAAFDPFDDGINESFKKKTDKPKRSSSKSTQRVRIVKPKIPMMPEAVDTGAEVKPPPEKEEEEEVATKAKVVGSAEENKASKDTKHDAFEAGDKPPDNIHDRELKKLFRDQRKALQKMPFDSPPSSESEDEIQNRLESPAKIEQDVPVKKKTVKFNDGDPVKTDEGGADDDDGEHIAELIEQLVSRDDEESRNKLKLLLDRHTKNKDSKKLSQGDRRAETGNKIPNVAAARGTRGAAAAAEKIQEHRNDQAVLLQPPDGTIGCVIDKAFHLQGHEKSGTIEININFHAGRQTGDQSEPGRAYKALTMKAYLPATGDGRETLRLMKVAFTDRKLFTIERNDNDDDDDDVIVPNGIIFKTSADQFPDPGYLPKVMEQLRMLSS